MSLHAVATDAEASRWLDRARDLYFGGDHPGAVQALHHAARAAPLDPAPHTALGRLLFEMDQPAAAIAAFNAAADLGDPGVLSELSVAMGVACNWKGRSQRHRQLKHLIQRGQMQVSAHQGVLFELPLSVHLSMLGIQAANLAALHAPIDQKPRRSPKLRGGRFSLGLIAASFGSHAVTEQFNGVLELIDKARFGVRCYALNPDDHSTERKALRGGLCERWHDVSGPVWKTKNRARMVAAHQNQVMRSAVCAAVCAVRAAVRAACAVVCSVCCCLRNMCCSACCLCCSACCLRCCACCYVCCSEQYVQYVLYVLCAGPDEPRLCA